MRYRFYTLYRVVAGLKQRLHARTTPLGRLLVLFTVLVMVFGLNTRQTMMYQLATICFGVMIVAFFMSFFSTPKVRVRRILPKTCTTGEKIAYVLEAENNCPQAVAGVFFREQGGSGLPTYQEYLVCLKEEGSKRNVVDSKLGYYQWRDLLRKIVGVKLESHQLPDLLPGEKKAVEISLVPLRRGYLSLTGYVLFSLDPFGLFKKSFFVSAPSKMLALPQRYPVVSGQPPKSRKYHQGGLTAAAGSGDIGEFVSLREYFSGDPVKHIDWKATARTGETIIRQFEDEYFSRYGVVVDTYTTQPGGAVFEDVLSVAASIIIDQDITTNLVDMFLAGQSGVVSLSCGRGNTDQYSLLEALACADACSAFSFQTMTKTLMANLPLLSGVILILLDVDEQRLDLVRLLAQEKKSCKVIVVTADEQLTRKKLHRHMLHEAKIFPVDAAIKIVDLQ
ncbi:DUF58 domain-containing protein [Desulfogranum marinum]|uniref:DUF58 domain-containing protein n=1 Tax=Desulfogranum marinum TaxID=453220 RepID=UPI0029C99A7E|nr:DUF58 domain-containing protein [Desulfogranum marinum]